MNKQQKQAFNKLMKVEVINWLKKIELEISENAKVTRTCKSDHERTLKYIEYGFVEGIKFAKGGKS